MITNDKGERLTPKQAAQDLILDAIAGRVGYWQEGNNIIETYRITEQEKSKLQEQIVKQFERVQKLFNQSGWTLG